MNQWDDQEWFNSIYHSTQKQLSLQCFGSSGTILS